jgi:putative ABC transport system ATP-binding protein
VIQATGVSKVFSSGNREIRAVDDVELGIRQGEFALIVGRSGSGKSTLLGMLAGLIRPSSGTIRIRGSDLGLLADTEISALRSREIGFVFQFSGLLPTLTALENVMVPTLFTPNGGGGRARAAELLETVGLTERADTYPGTLSSGEMKRVAIARALINRPSLLIADEPTGDLDVDTEREIMDLFRRLNHEGMTIVMVTHNPDLVTYATRMFRMERGRMEEISHPDTSISASPKTEEGGSWPPR